jgi:hypothetical protein
MCEHMGSQGSVTHAQHMLLRPCGALMQQFCSTAANARATLAVTSSCSAAEYRRKALLGILYGASDVSS